jgi:tetratricopeptide (TPR) repeat protein
LAKAYVALGEYDEAKELAVQALQTAQTAKSPHTEADALLELGRADMGLENPTQSLSAVEQAIARYQQLDVAHGLAEAAHMLALVLADLAVRESDPVHRISKLDEALAQSAQALVHAEELLQNVVAPELRAYYSSTHRGYYQTHINLLMYRYRESLEERFVAEALATSERARARMTMDLLNEASVDLQQRVDPQVAAEISRLLDQLAEIAE